MRYNEILAMVLKNQVISLNQRQNLLRKKYEDTVGGNEFAIPNRICYRTVSVPFSVFFTVSFFTAIATVSVPFFSLTVGSAKRTEPLIVTVRFLVFDREPYRTKMETVIRLLLRTAIRTAPKLVRYGSWYRNKIGPVYR
jgi:hypothetical protein